MSDTHSPCLYTGAGNQVCLDVKYEPVSDMLNSLPVITTSTTASHTTPNCVIKVANISLPKINKTR